MRRYTLSTVYFKEYFKTSNNCSVNIQYLYDITKKITSLKIRIQNVDVSIKYLKYIIYIHRFRIK